MSVFPLNFLRGRVFLLIVSGTHALLELLGFGILPSQLSCSESENYLKKSLT